MPLLGKVYSRSVCGPSGLDYRALTVSNHSKQFLFQNRTSKACISLAANSQEQKKKPGKGDKAFQLWLQNLLGNHAQTLWNHTWTDFQYRLQQQHGSFMYLSSSSLPNQSTLSVLWHASKCVFTEISCLEGRGRAFFPPILQVFPLCTHIIRNIANTRRSLAFKMAITSKLMRKGNSGQFYISWFLYPLPGCFPTGRYDLPTSLTKKNNTNRYKKANLVAFSMLWTHCLWLISEWYKYFYLKGELQLSELGSDSFFYSHCYSGWTLRSYLYFLRIKIPKEANPFVLKKKAKQLKVMNSHSFFGFQIWYLWSLTCFSLRKNAINYLVCLPLWSVNWKTLLLWGNEIRWLNFIIIQFQVLFST